jgi:hypothetical protein
MLYIKREFVHKATIALQVFIIPFHVLWEPIKLATKHPQRHVSLFQLGTTTMSLPKYFLRFRLSFALQVTTVLLAQFLSTVKDVLQVLILANKQAHALRVPPVSFV